MAINHDEQPRTNRIVSFRAPQELADAIEREASKRFCSVSDVARELVVCDLRRRGLLDQAQ